MAFMNISDIPHSNEPLSLFEYSVRKVISLGLMGETKSHQEWANLIFNYENKAFVRVELMSIVIRSSAVLGIEVDEEGALEIAKRSRGTPRLANRLLKRVRDFAEVEHQGKIDYNVARSALDKLDVDGYGLDDTDRNILTTIIKNFGGGPVGLDVLAAAIGEDSGTIEDVYEPYLIKNGFINRTPRGRVCTEKAYKHLDLEYMLG